MLDAIELAERLKAAMDLRVPPITSSDMARRMGVTKQAVYEWRTSGRIAKRHLDGIAKETELPLEYFLESTRGSSPTTKAIWRRLGRAFAKVALFLLMALPPFLASTPAEAVLHNKIRHDHAAVFPRLSRVISTHCMRFAQWLRTMVLNRCYISFFI